MDEPATVRVFDEALMNSNGVTAPALLYKVGPDYCEEARRAHVEGVPLRSLLVTTVRPPLGTLRYEGKPKVQALRN
jgi:hypothetical protein